MCAKSRDHTFLEFIDGERCDELVVHHSVTLICMAAEEGSMVLIVLREVLGLSDGIRDRKMAFVKGSRMISLSAT